MHASIFLPPNPFCSPPPHITCGLCLSVHVLHPQKQGVFHEYYANALRYLGCTDYSNLQGTRTCVCVCVCVCVRVRVCVCVCVCVC